jgi:subfamily B ATP-binding cassette protein MsbA
MPAFTLVKTILASLAFAGFEVIGLGFMIPIVAYMQSRSEGVPLPTNQLFTFLTNIGVPITLTTVLSVALIPIILRQAAQYIRESELAKTQHETIKYQRTQLIDAILDADLRFVIENKQGELANTLTMDAYHCGTIARDLSSALGTSLILFIYICGLFYVSWSLSLTAIPLVVGIGFLFRHFFSRGRQFGNLLTEANGEFSFQALQGLSAMRLIKMSGGESDTKSRFNTVINTIFQTAWKIEQNRFRLEAMSQPLLLIGVCSLLIYAVDGLKIGLGELGMFMALVLRCQPQLIGLNGLRLGIISSIPHLERIESAITAAHDSQSIASGHRSLDHFTDELSFENVSFAYPGVPESLVLNGLSFTIKRGQSVALVGRSGAGKSTAIDLIPRLYDPIAGRVLLDGIPLDQFDLVSLRRRMAFVTQEPLLLHDTIRRNLTFGLLQPKTDDELWHCLDLAQAKSFVAEIGLDTIVGERGHRLSGGQRQRLTLARALLQNPEILILDEPTASLDTVSEEAIKVALEGLRHQLTIIMVAHRLSTIQSADQIIVLENGKVAGQGTHKELLETCSAYGLLHAGQVLQ